MIVWNACEFAAFEKVQIVFQIHDSCSVIMYINAIWTHEYKEPSEIDYVDLGRA